MIHRLKMIYLVVALSIGLSACGQKFVWEKTLWKNGENVPYEICTESNLPANLKQLVEEKKGKKGTFTFTDSENIYMVTCYGTKEKSGYSIQVETVEKTQDGIRVKLHLLGPAEGTALPQKSTPYIVIKLKRGVYEVRPHPLSYRAGRRFVRSDLYNWVKEKRNGV